MLSNKVVRLAESAKYDVCLSSCSSGAGGQPGRTRKPENPLHEWIYPASVPGQGRVHILKILQSNKCRNSCTYCKFSAANDSEKRISLSPDELAASFMDLVYFRLVEGIFISSGVCRTPEYAMEEMIKTADILRNRYRFQGYIHLKIIPGAPDHLIEKAAELADRLSINMEAPTDVHLKEIAPEKSLENNILPAAAKAAEVIRNGRQIGRTSGIRAVSQTTQYVVGAAGELDLDIMKSVDSLYRDYYMFRAYFSAYQEGYGTDTSKKLTGSKLFAGSPLLREHRLYQCDFLMRAYGFRLGDLVFDKTGNIPLETDPKTAWAVMNPGIFPIEINTAPIELLLRVPGIGPVSAERIVRMRRTEKLTSIDDLRAAGAWSGRAAGWIELNGKTPVITEERKITGRDPAGRFNPAQKWLFDEIAPDGWRQCEAADSGGTDGRYPYPGQKGKWVNYSFGNRDTRVVCR